MRLVLLLLSAFLLISQTEAKPKPKAKPKAKTSPRAKAKAQFAIPHRTWPGYGYGGNNVGGYGGIINEALYGAYDYPYAYPVPVPIFGTTSY